MSFLRRVDAFWNVVLFPMETCAFDFAKIAIGDLTGILDLKSRSCIEILRQSETFVRVKCSDLATKRQVLSWATRSIAASQFAVRIKEDLFKFERQEKAKMWRVMQALYHGGLRPSWDRSSITYKLENQRLYIHPHEVPEDLIPDEILTFAKSENSSETQNFVTALQQDLALAKQRIAAQSIQCCLWRNKFKVLEARAGPSKFCKPASSQTEVTAQATCPPQVDDATLAMVQAVQQEAQNMVMNMQTQVTALQALADKKVAEAQAQAQQFMQEIQTLKANLERLEKRKMKR